MVLLVISLLIIVLLMILGIFGMKLASMDFFCAFPRTAAYGNPNKLRFIHLKGLLFVISEDIWGNDVVYSNEASNMMFKYNLRPVMNPKEIMNSKKDLNIEILDSITNQTMSYTVTHANKAQAIKFFAKYRDLMQRIHAHKTEMNNGNI